MSELIVADENSLVWYSLTVGRFDQEHVEALLELRGGAPALTSIQDNRAALYRVSEILNLC